MNEADISIRKKWLISIISITIFNQITILIDIINIDKMLDIPPFANYLNITIITIVSIAFLWVCYRCAYKKPGTKLLTFFLIATPIGILVTAIYVILGKLPSVTQSWGTMTLAIMQQMGGLWLFYFNWKLRIINKKLQSKNLKNETAFS
jgi:hypothetical protein